MKKIIAFIIILTFVFICRINISASETISGKAYMFPADIGAKLLSIGVNKGYGMDRTDVGIYMPAGSSFKIRSKDNRKFNFEILNNNPDNEKTVMGKNSYTVTNDWTTITAEVDSVPFIKSGNYDYSEVEYEITDMVNTQPLTIFKKGQDENAYINTWKSNDQQYSIITDDYVTFLVPRVDIGLIEKIITNTSEAKYKFSSLNDMLNWYDGVIKRYNNYIGLSENATEIYNKDLRMKFFFKPNVKGVGYAAYYYWNYVATNSDSVSSVLEKGWLTLHEMGHGFQSYYTSHLSNNDINLKEVENNFFAYEEEQKILEPSDPGWLWKHDQAYYMDIINGVSTFNELMGDGSFAGANAEARLFAFVNLFEKIGMRNTMSYSLRKYRSILSEGGTISNKDLYGLYFSESSNYNVIPYLNYVKIDPSESTEDIVYANKQPIIYPIAYVFNEQTSQGIANNLNLRGIYSIIENDEIENFTSNNNITRNVKFKITTEDVKKLNHKKIFIKNASNDVVKEAVLSGDEIIIENVPVGLYYVDISNGVVDNLRYLLVQQSNNQLNQNINYTYLEENNPGENNPGENNPGGISTDENNPEENMEVKIEYEYDPKNVDDFGEIVDVPDTGVLNYIYITIGMIFISLGIGAFVYIKKNKVY